jgi:hypothetical protein
MFVLQRKGADDVMNMGRRPGQLIAEGISVHVPLPTRAWMYLCFGNYRDATIASIDTSR